MMATLSMWVAVQAVQIGLRTLITDDCTPSEQANANAWASAYSNFAATMANLAAYADLLPHSWGANAQGMTVFMKLSLATILVLTITTTISCISVKEEQTPLPECHECHTAKDTSLATTLRINVRLLGEASQIRTIYLVQFFAWLTWFPFLYYMVPYVKHVHAIENRGRLYLNASEQPESKIGSLTLLTFSMVAFIGAVGQLYLTKVTKSCSIRRMWITSQGVLGLCLLATLIISSSTGTIILFCIVGISWAASSWIPFALLAIEISRCESPSIGSRNPLGTRHQLDEEKNAECEAEDISSAHISGLVYGLHNFAICLPQMLMSFAIGLQSLSSSSKDDADNKISIVFVLRIGGCFAVIAMFIARGIRHS